MKPLPKPADTADAKTQFEVLYGDLRDFHKGAFDGAFKAIGFALIVLGWLISSKEAQDFFKGEPEHGCAAILAVGLSSLIYVAATYRLYQMSSATAKLLDKLCFMPAENYSERRISKLALLILCSANILLAAVTSFVIYELEHRGGS